MKDRTEAILHFLAEAEVALAKARAELAIERLDAAMEPPKAPRGTTHIVQHDMPVAALNDEPPSRPA